MLTLNAGTKNEVTLQVVLESKEHGREYFDHYDNLGEMLEAVKRLVERSSDCAAADGIERVVGITIHPKVRSADECGQTTFCHESP